MHGGIRRAADALGVNASAISRQLAQLERALQLPLLERRGRNVVLTDAGKLLAEDYALTSQRRRQLERQLQDMRHMRGGSVTLRVGQGMADEVPPCYSRVFAGLSGGVRQYSVGRYANHADAAGQRGGGYGGQFWPLRSARTAL